MKIDFVKLLNYFEQKYPKLKDVRYYEGIAKGDEKKYRMFEYLTHKGYTICPLERKSYNSVETEEKAVQCPRCNYKWTVEFTKEHKAMKSNVDVYLATELLSVAHRVTEPTHIVLVSCDGDYAEMISNALENENVTISVLATPTAKDFTKNTLSVRLKQLYNTLGVNHNRYHLRNIANIGFLGEKYV